jgi:hypothetical protein
MQQGTKQFCQVYLGNQVNYFGTQVREDGSIQEIHSVLQSAEPFDPQRISNQQIYKGKVSTIHYPNNRTGNILE